MRTPQNDRRLDAPTHAPRRYHSAAVFLAAAVTLFAAAPGWAQPTVYKAKLAGPPSPVPPDLALRGTWGGAVRAVFVDPAEPDIAYVGAGRRLVILNVADPADIIELGSLDLENMVWDLQVGGGYAYVATDGPPNRFCIVNVADLTNPQLVWHYSETGYNAREVDLYGDAVYVRHSTRTLNAFDISDPENPVYMGQVTTSWVNAVSIVGDLMYVADDHPEPPELQVYDLSTDPFNPLPLGSDQLTWPPAWWGVNAVAVEGDYACMVSRRSDRYIAVVDVSNPQAPVDVGYYHDDYITPLDVALSNGFAYVADREGSFPDDPAGLMILDIATDPTDPTLVNTFQTYGCVCGIEVVGTRAYVMDDGEGVIILDLSDPVNPVRLGNWHSPAEFQSMDQVGDLLYAADKWYGVTILNVSDPCQPTLVGAYRSEGVDIGHVKVRDGDGLAYLAAGYAGLEVLDVSDPANPTCVGCYSPWPEGCKSMALDVSEYDGMIVAHVTQTLPYACCDFVDYDVTDPENIVILGQTGGIGGGPIKLPAIDVTPDHMVFLTPNRVVEVDCADPYDPNPIYHGSFSAVGLAHEDGLLYVTYDFSTGAEGLHILDAANLAVELGWFPVLGPAGVDVQNGLVYLTAAYEGARQLLALHVSDPETPIVVAHLPIPSAGRVLVNGHYAYVTPVGNTSALTGVVIVEIVPGRELGALGAPKAGAGGHWPDAGPVRQAGIPRLLPAPK